MRKFISLIGWLFIISGLVIGTYICLYLTKPVVEYGVTYYDPHPLKIIYGLITIAVGIFLGCVLLGISEIIKAKLKIVNNEKTLSN
jgi:ABC-type transport system involved in multi-copper enzyme maturation permease subunit